MSVWPIKSFEVCTAARAIAKQVNDQNHRSTLLNGLSRFTPYIQYKMAKAYVAKLTPAVDAWYKNEPTNPSEIANAWFCDELNVKQHRIDTTFISISTQAKAALAKIHNNNHHNHIIHDLVISNKPRSIQASYVRQTAQLLADMNKAKLKRAEHQSRDLSDAEQSAELSVTRMAGGKVTSSAMALINGIGDQRQIDFVHDCLANVPKPLQLRFAKRFITKYDASLRDIAKASKDELAEISKAQFDFDGKPKEQTIPEDFKSHFKQQYKANAWLRRTVNTLKPRLKILKQITNSMPLPWYILANAEKTKKHASELAAKVTEILSDLASENPNWNMVDLYEAIAEFAAQYQVKLVNVEKGDYLTEPDAEIALLKAQCHKWWARKLKTLRRRYLEHLEIATGEVGRDLFTRHSKKEGTVTERRGINAYCSKQALKEYQADRDRGRRYLESLELVNEQNDVISLMKAVEAGVANPENMRNELMLRIRETEELANEMGYVGGFFNITAPSRFHANSANWDGSTPKDASNYLNKLYSQARAKLDREEIPYFGIRVAEPHADGCAHWHMLLWMPERYYHKVNHVLRRYFTKDDRAVFFERFKKRKSLRARYVRARRIWGLNKKRKVYTREPKKDYNPSGPRYTAIKMDPPAVDKEGNKTGGAAAYIAKYVSKNIDGFALANEHDAETGEKLTKAVNPVKAWASTWGIRQFQFQKAPSITIWRELRRVREEIKGNEQLEQVRKAADTGDYKTFVTLMGGFGIGRDARFKPAYQQTEFGNAYAECTKRLKGVVDEFSQCTLVTRVHTWDKQPIGTAAANDSAFDASMHDANNVGAADLSWTSGNNCTPCPTGHRDGLLLDMIGYSQNEIAEVKKDLIAGKKVHHNGRIYMIRNGQLHILDEDKQLLEHRKQAIDYIAQTEAQKQHKLLGEQRSVPVKAHLYDFEPEHIQQLKDGGTIVIGDHVYHLVGDTLQSFEKLDLSVGTQPKEAAINPTEQHYTFARELYDLACSYAQIEGRNLPSSTQFKHGHADVIGDLELARLVLAGEAMAISDNDWWALDLMA